MTKQGTAVHEGSRQLMPCERTHQKILEGQLSGGGVIGDIVFLSTMQLAWSGRMLPFSMQTGESEILRDPTKPIAYVPGDPGRTCDTAVAFTVRDAL